MFGGRLEYSYVRDLRADPDQDENEEDNANRRQRPVNSGHYVRVAPTPLRVPYLVAVSDELVHTLGLNPADATSAVFLRTFSGDLTDSPGFETRGWATPYALSIYGEEVLPPGTGPRGNGYGDGRAISIGEVVLPDGVI